MPYFFQYGTLWYFNWLLPCPCPLDQDWPFRTSGAVREKALHICHAMPCCTSSPSPPQMMSQPRTHGPATCAWHRGSISSPGSITHCSNLPSLSLHPRPAHLQGRVPSKFGAACLERSSWNSILFLRRSRSRTLCLERTNHLSELSLVMSGFNAEMNLAGNAAREVVTSG